MKEDFSIVEGERGPRLRYDGQPPRTLEQAWEMSLAKWHFLSEHPGIRDGHWTTCGLCLFYSGHDLCHDCPIASAGYWDCEGSPYYLYQADPTPENARRELEFLKRIKAESESECEQ